MGHWRSRWSGIQEVGDGVEGLDEPFLFRGAEAAGIPSIHLAGVEQCTANGGLRNESLHPGGEDFGDPRVVLGIEDILHSPQIQSVVPVEDRPHEATQVLATDFINNRSKHLPPPWNLGPKTPLESSALC